MDGTTTVAGWQRAGVIAFGAAWVAVATAETLLGSRDALDDVAVIGASAGRIAAAGLIHVMAGALLAGALAVLAAPAWRTVLGRVGWVLAAVTAPCLGAFGMLHLLAVETAAPGLDAAAMQQFLVDRLSAAPGPWGVPVLFVAFVGTFALPVLAAGLARARVAPWAAAAVAGAGAVLHFFGGGVEALEVASHWVLAAGLAWAAVGLWRAVSVGDATSVAAASAAPAVASRS
jgi:hypothetical protein